MGKKKGKNTKQQEEVWGDETAAEKVLEGIDEGDIDPVGPARGPKRGGGKKSKRKRSLVEDYDIEAEMDDTSEKGSGEPESSTKQLIEPPTSERTAGREKSSGKREKHDDAGCDDDIAQQVAALSLEDTGEHHHAKQQEQQEPATSATGKSGATEDDKAAAGSKKGKKARKAKKKDASEEIDQLLQEIEEGPPTQSKSLPANQPAAVDNQDGGGDKETAASAVTPSEEVGEPAKDEFHVKTKAEKKKEKKIKKKQDAKPKGKAPQQQGPQEEEQGQPQPQVTETVKPEAEQAAQEAAERQEDEKEDDDKRTEDKKKKKKDKSAKDDKKGVSKAAKKKTAIQKMKEEIESLRMAQKKREEEELARLKAAEEAERKRLEQLQLEQERKERKKQREKEKRERLRAEGKLLTRAEKERRARTEIQLAALKESGVIVPEKKTDDESALEKKKPVRYGNRVRPKKKKNPSHEAADEAAVEDICETQPAESEEMSTDICEDSVEEKVKENWDDEDDQEPVKDNWDDESDDDEEDVKSVSHCSVASTPSATQLQAMDSEVNEEESEAESESENSDSGESEEEEEDETLTPYDRAARRIKEYRIRCQEERSLDLLRSPVVCVLGHVDTGKTKILDKIRHTHVQDGEAGGITQQIGATFVPEESVREQTKMLKEFQKAEIKLPGLLIIDTPGHESFSNLRTRGSSMCDIAILVVDIMHGLEPQTIESLNLLLKGKTPFIVALNKIDRLFDWRRNPNSGVRENIKRQKQNTKDEFEERTRDVVTQFAEQGINAALFWEKVNFTEYIPMVPTSAITGDGMGDLIALVVTYSQKMLAEKLMFSKHLEAIVMEVKVISGLGTTIDVILRNGILNEGDTLILTGSEGPFVTQARALLMPQALRELRVKNAYINHKVVIASQGVKICAKELEKALAGTQLLVAKRQDEIDVLKEEAASMMSSALSSFKLKERGVFVQASTLGSLEALVDFLVHSKIPYAGVNIGPVHKKDVMKASVMLERDSQWAVILAFDVRVEREAQELADSLGVKIFTADIIYHLFDNFIKHREELRERKRREFEHIAVFPCKLRVLPNCVFNARNPIVVGVQVEAGIVKPGTPITIPSKNFTDLGIITSLEMNHKPVDVARKGAEVCIKIEPTPGDAPKLYGRHFDLEDTLVSKISRESINAVKNYFREDLQKADWQLMVQLKKIFQIM